MFKYRLGTAPSDALEASAGSLLAFQNPAPLGDHISGSELYKLVSIGLRDADSNLLSQFAQFGLGQFFSTLHRQQCAIDHVAAPQRQGHDLVVLPEKSKEVPEHRQVVRPFYQENLREAKIPIAGVGEFLEESRQIFGAFKKRKFAVTFGDLSQGVNLIRG